MNVKISQFQNNSCVFDVMPNTSASGAPIDDVSIASRSPFIFRKGHKTAPLNYVPIF